MAQAGDGIQDIGVAVIGAGQAGLSLSRSLAQQGIDHVVFERDRPFSAWRNRWEGFRTNTPNWMNTLPLAAPQPALAGDPDGFAPRDELVRYFDLCLAAVEAPVLSGQEVTRIGRRPDGGWLVEAGAEVYRARAVAICNGAMSAPRLPPPASGLPSGVPQLHSSQYRSPDQIATRRVLVVGTASSGAQIARLLCQSGRFASVHAAMSKVLVLPRAILGVPVHRVVHRLGLFDVRTHSTLGRLLYSNLEGRGDPIMPPTPHDLQRQLGLDLRGRFAGVENGAIRFADGTSLPTEDLTVLWCTGFRPDYGILDAEERVVALHPSGHPKHVRGVSEVVPGLFFVGLRYQHTVASHDIYGVAADAAFVAGAIGRHLRARSERAPVSAR